MYKSGGWYWHNNHNGIIKGRLWGGCLEVLALHLSVKNYLPDFTELKRQFCLLKLRRNAFGGFVYRFIAALGEIGFLKKFKAILMAYPKAQFCDKQPPEGREAFILNQQIAVKNALSDYDSDIPVIFNMNFGHTDPQLIIPNGGIASIDGARKTISFS